MSVVVFGSWVLEKKGFVSGIIPSDIDVLLYDDGHQEEDSVFLSLLRKEFGMNINIDLHKVENKFKLENIHSSLGIFQNEPYFFGNDFQKFIGFLQEKVNPAKISYLKTRISHLIRGVRYFEKDSFDFYRENIFFSETPYFSISRYHTQEGAGDDLASMLVLGRTSSKGASLEESIYDSLFVGNSVQAVLAALRKCEQWGVKNSLLEKFSPWRETLEEAVNILQCEDVDAIEESGYGPRANLAGLKKLIETGRLKEVANGHY